MNEGMNERMNEWINEWMNEWMLSSSSSATIVLRHTLAKRDKNSVREPRTAEHRCHIRNEAHRKLEVSHHVFECAGHLPVPFRIMPLYKMPLNCTRIERESKELFFQKKFCPSLHPGPRITNDWLFVQFFSILVTPPVSFVISRPFLCLFPPFLCLYKTL